MSPAAVAVDQAALRPYVPRLVVDWLRTTPDARVREVHGSLAFVDISGFTALTERLARKGRVGAEEMSDTLSAVFSGLLAIAYEDGAGLVKWGGDAVLLLYEGDEHAARAARAALRMRAALRVLGDVDTSAGRVRLRMSVGIHSGTFTFFLVGDPALHRELLVAGPAATATAQAESLATAGQVVLSAAAAVGLDERLLRRLPDGSALLTGEPQVPAWPAPPQPPTTGLDLGSTLSAPMRRHVAEAAGEPEHRRVAVAFVRFSGTDDLLAEAGPAALTDALHECVANVQEACDRHGVTFFETDIDANGGKVMLVAGAPTSAGSNEERLLLACRLVLDRPGVLPLRVGVNAGGVFAGDFGPEFRRTYSVKGDAVNLAARVMARAAPGQLLATTAVVEASRTSFETEPLTPFLVKGKARPVEAASIGPVRRESRADTDELPLVGRDVELAALDAALAQVRRGTGVVVDLVGEPGIGKSRLVEELRRRSDGLRVLQATCEEYESSTPYHPVRALLHEVAALPADTAPEEVLDALTRHVEPADAELVPLLPLLGVPLDVALPDTAVTAGLDEQYRKAKVEETALRYLQATLAGPTVVVLDDVHWMDDASADLLAGVVGAAADRPWLVVTTRRDVETGLVPAGADVVRLRPAPIDPAAALALVEQRTASTPLPPHVLAAIAERAGGNPLFLRSLLEAARSGGLGAADDALPHSVEGLVTSQIDRLPTGERALLRYAAVLGVTFAEEHLRTMLGAAGMPAGRDSMRRLAGFLEPAGHGRFRFRHALIRQAAYEGLSFRRRRELHGRVGELLETASTAPDELAELLSMHYFHAGRADKAWHYSRVAGERSRSRYAYVEAAEFLTRAVDSSRRLPEVEGAVVARVQESLGDVQMLVGDSDDARRSYRSARSRLRADDLVAATHLLLQEAKVELHQGRTRQCLHVLTRGMRLLDGTTQGSTDPAALTGRARLESFYAWSRFRQGRYGEADRWARTAEEHATKAGDNAALAEIYAVLQQVATWSSHAQDRPYGRLALELYEALDDRAQVANMLNNLAGQAFFDGEWTDALDMYGRASAGYAEVGNQLGVLTALYNQAEILSRQRHYDDARAHLVRVRRDAGGFGDPDLAATAARELGRLQVLTGQVADGRETLEQARADFTAMGESYEVLATDLELVAADLADGDVPAALASCDDVRARASAMGVAALRPTIGRLRGAVLLAAGRLDEAETELRDALASADEQGSYETGALMLLLADLVDGDEALRLRADGERHLAGLGVPTGAAPPVR